MMKKTYYYGEGLVSPGNKVEESYEILELSNQDILNLANEKKCEVMIDTNGYGFALVDKETGIEDYYKEESDQGLIYKNTKEFYDMSTCTCYVTENDSVYSFFDILEACNFNFKLASAVFEICDWQSPEALVDDIKSDCISYQEYFNENEDIIQTNKIVLLKINEDEYKLMLTDYSINIADNFNGENLNKVNIYKSLVDKGVVKDIVIKEPFIINRIIKDSNLSSNLPPSLSSNSYRYIDIS